MMKTKGTNNFPRPQTRGAALLMAMLTLVLVASLAAGVTWQQWRGIETERAERSRAQTAWILVGALDWARLILREDARSGGADHLGEPWAVALQESRLTTFLAADANNSAQPSEQLGDNVFLSGQILDMQSRLNLYDLVIDGRIAPPMLAALVKLYDLLGLEVAEVKAVAENLRSALDQSPDNRSAASAALLPQQLDQMTLLGMSPRSLERLRPYIIWLPGRTPVNMNTASAEVLFASVPSLDLDGARKLVAERQRQHFRSLSDVVQLLPSLAGQLEGGNHSVASRYFEITGRLRSADGAGDTVVIERSVVQRDGLEVKVLWRERGAFPISAVKG